MIILNDKRFSDENFFYAKTLEDISNSPNNSTIIFKYNEDDIKLYKFCQTNNISYGVEIDSIKEFIFIINLNAKYTFCNNIELASTIQKIADNYLTQTKVIIKTSFELLEKAVLHEIDGIFVI